MENRIGIVNYLIVLQICNFNRNKAHIEYIKNESFLLLKPFEECIFDFDSDSMKLYDKYDRKLLDNVNHFLDEMSSDETVIFYKNENYPKYMFDVDKYPLCFFAKGNVGLLNNHSRAISIVGTRNPSDNAINNTNRIVRFLINRDVTIVSGLAKGIDGIAHKVCKEYEYNKLIGVIGTPLNKSYPKENRELQKYVSDTGCLISEMPYFESTKRWSFTRRNFVMSLFSKASIVMEASDTSGTISQARHTLRNDRYLLVPYNVFSNPNNSWPSKFRTEYNKIYSFNSFEELKGLMSEIQL
ncbi:hypothetical protein HF295_04630 [Hujiaoplasma nucleasis]|uniref:Smf/DprA SLOG domain-containing protein n=1 Tax=Hujiaoplasma nucleasis TaxID=2725268 RepID=A0A7L6N5A4_9MOLU|nr:DNA-processing protein DprA [Hujiaoplasma nucleasis]QLY40185.1 hypothetical protein HF295_04630 [Hujiaoplasma nucleasis]